MSITPSTMSHCESDSDSEEEERLFMIVQKTQKYIKALHKFNIVKHEFEEAIPNIAKLPWEFRGHFVLENYEKHLFGLHDRPKQVKMKCIKGEIDELKSFCTALCIGWKLWPDYWTGIEMMLDYLAEDTLDEDIKQLSSDTLTILKEIALCMNWPNNRIFGHLLSSQAKRIIDRHFKPVPTIVSESALNPFLSFGFPIAVEESKKICEGVDCFEMETDAVKFKCCARCKKVFYHSKECQIKAWKAGHKASCISS